MLIVTTREDDVRELESPAGVTVMEIICDADLASPFAVCGGSCTCATRHVHIDARFASAVPVENPDESDVLDGSDHRTSASRLSCQLEFGPAPDGLKVTIAPAE